MCAPSAIAQDQPSQISVRDTGAVGDGIQDDTAAIQKAIDKLPARGGTVLFPAGTYRISSTLRVGDGDGGSNASSRNGIKLIGEGGGFAVSGALIPTILDWHGGAGMSMIAIHGQISDCVVEGMFLACNLVATTGIYMRSVSGCRLENVKIVNYASVGLGILGGAAPVGNYNIFNRFNAVNCVSQAPNSIGLYMDGDWSVQNDTWLSSFRNCRFEVTPDAKGGVAAWFNFVDSISFYRCHFTTYNPEGFGVIFDAIGNHDFPSGMAFYDCSISNTVVYESPTEKIRKNYFIGHGTYDHEVVPTHPLLIGVTDTGETFNGWGQDASPWTAYVPSVQGPSGASVTGRFKRDGRTVHIALRVQLGNAIGVLTTDLPFPAKLQTALAGAEAGSGRGLTVVTTAGVRTIRIRRATDGGVPGVPGEALLISGSYEID
ncbi:MAG: hypothetical protein H6832_05810 [Planctomycetes bacterium]|nr:hypothetical protein [Planctomycetota bacterium]MCB9891603.1 hypothetical protein [Planctomycetota bacterium]MCB9917900.1 hypothetical protein [Planctomycetota bacterium]